MTFPAYVFCLVFIWMDRRGRIRSVCGHYYSKLSGSQHPDCCVSDNMELRYKKIISSGYRRLIFKCKR